MHGISSAQSCPPTSSDGFGMRLVSTSPRSWSWRRIMVEAGRQPFDVHARRHRLRKDCGRRPTASCRAAACRRTFVRLAGDSHAREQAVRKLLQRDRRLAALRTVRRRAISSISSLPSRASGSLRDAAIAAVARNRAPAADRSAAFGRCSASDSARLIWSGSWTQKCIIAVGRPHFQPDRNSLSASASADPSSTIAEAATSWSIDGARLPRAVMSGMRPAISSNSCHSASSPRKAIRSTSHSKTLLVRKLQPSRAPPGARIHQRLRRAISHWSHPPPKRKDRRPKPAVSVWGCLAFKPC